MDVGLLLGPAVVAAIVSGVITTIGFFVNAATATKLHGEKLEADAKLAERKVDADIELAERKFRLDREMAEWKRRNDFAEEVLAGFYKARAIFSTARTPFARPGEGSTRPVGEDEAGDRNGYKDAVYAPLERLNREIDFLNELNSKRYRFSALFGRQADQSFADLIGAYHEVSMATAYLIRDYRTDNSKRTESYEAAIGWGTDGDDAVATKLDDAVALIEQVCGPVLQRPAP